MTWNISKNEFVGIYEITSDTEDDFFVEIWGEKAKEYGYVMAAAPELLEALEELADIVDGLNNGDDYKIDCFTTQPARAAIAKAKGVVEHEEDFDVRS